MASPLPPKPVKTLEQVVREIDRYPIDAFHFIHQGLGFTVERLHGKDGDAKEPRHVSGRQLASGLKDFAQERWGMLARTVLQRWQIHSTSDFGRIVFAMVDSGLLAKTDEDNFDDFANVFDFREAFDRGYRVPVDALDRQEAKA